MITLFKKQPVPTVEQIHAEIDSAESKILDECERVLNTLNILTQSKIEKKALIRQSILQSYSLDNIK